MSRRALPRMLLLMAATAALGAAASTGLKPVAVFGFDEGGGSVSVETTGAGLVAALSPSAKWARGSFGTALATGVQGASATLDPIAALDRTDSCAIALRIRKEGADFGTHPCVLSTTGWAEGGVLLTCEGGRLSVRLRSDSGEECRMPLADRIPEGRWQSVVLSFSRPDVRVFVDGKLAVSGKWKHALAVKGALVVGSWGQDSFGGLIDDVRVYGSALTAADAEEYAGAGGYEEVEGYQDDGTGGVQKTEFLGQVGSPFAMLKGDSATLTFDAYGAVISLRENASGRELVTNCVPFVGIRMADGSSLAPQRLEKRSGSSFAWIFPGGRGEIALSVRAFNGGWTFAVDAVSVRTAKTLSLCRLRPSCRKWTGTFANAWSDERSAVCVRSYGLYGEPQSAGAELAVDVEAPFPAKGLSVGLAAGPRKGFLRQLQAMTVEAGVPRSNCGGAWSIGSDEARRSYVFADVVDGDIDYWIDFVKRAGFSVIHITSAWSDCFGPYTFRRTHFPGGLEQMKETAQKVHDAGLQVGMHTLTACIHPHADWISPVCSSNLVADATYTLAVPLEPQAKEIVVNERPIDRHSTVFTYSSSGNVLRLGGELIQYSGIRREKPYAFTGLKRGAFGTRKSIRTVSAGTAVDYVHQRYCCFYPEPDSELADRLADRLAEVYNACNLDEFYYDGSEGMGTRYGIDAMRHKIYTRLKPNNGHSPLIEASCQNANNWWFQTRTCTTDHGVWGVKRFHDWHLGWGIDRGRCANFMEPQMGWWQPRVDEPRARGHFPDEMEYFAAKNTGHDTAMSIQGVSARPLPAGVRRQLTLLGWYEHARLARCLTPEALSYLAKPRTEARLRQDDSGVWRLTEVESFVHRAGLPWERSWTVNSAAARPAALRVEALYRTKADETGMLALSADDFAQMKTAAAPGVKVMFEPTRTDPAYGRTFRLAAHNQTAPRRGAWASSQRTFAFPGCDFGKKGAAFRAWVKGDGSGALLNLQVSCPPEYGSGISDHYVSLDFTGWRQVEFLLRERDSLRYSDYVWPYGAGYAAIYRNFIDPRHVCSFAAYLNDIPVGGGASVEIGEVQVLGQVAGGKDFCSVSVNGEKFDIPFALRSGEYAELEPDGWTHYSACGDKLEFSAVSRMPSLASGANKVTLEATKDVRAEVSLFALGESRPAFCSDLTSDMRRELRYEGMMPFEYLPSRGLQSPTCIPVRPGETATLGVEVYGPCEDPTLTFKSFFGMSRTDCRFETAVAADEKLICRDGVNWQIVKAKDGRVTGRGVLSEPLPELNASRDFTFEARLPKDGMCVVDIMKNYR